MANVKSIAPKLALDKCWQCVLAILTSSPLRSNTMFCLLLTLILVSCAKPADRSAMTVSNAEVQIDDSSLLRDGIAIGAVTGGQPTDAMGVSEVGKEDFAGALRDSLAANHLLCERGVTCPFKLDANLLGLSQPAWGINIEVTAYVNYVLYKSQNEDPIFVESITTSASEISKPFISMPGSALRVANEGAIRENLAEFLRRLSHQQLSYLRTK